MKRRRALGWLAAGAASGAAPALRAADARASASAMLRTADVRPIRCIVPFAPGGPIDVTARLVCAQAAQTLGQAIVIENKPGAGGGIGVEALARSAPDGQTIGIAALAMHAVNPWLFRKVPYDPIRDFAPITQMVRIPNVLVMGTARAKDLGVAVLGDFIRYAKAHPARLTYASGGNGSGGHLAGEMFKQRAGFFAVHVPYNGGAPSQLALLAGTVDFTLDNLATSAANIASGKLLPLAVTSARRTPLLPQVPAIAERLPGFDVDTWWGLAAPAGTPPEMVQRLNAAFVAALRDPAVVQKFAQLMAEPVPTTPQAFAALIAAEHRRYEAVVKASGATTD